MYIECELFSIQFEKKYCLMGLKIGKINISTFFTKSFICQFALGNYKHGKVPKITSLLK